MTLRASELYQIMSYNLKFSILAFKSIAPIIGRGYCMLYGLLGKLAFYLFDSIFVLNHEYYSESPKKRLSFSNRYFSNIK
jgi:hypothetical protein